MPVACVLLQPWALKVAERQYPDVPLALLSEGRRVIEANSRALETGVRPGMPSTAALGRCPELHLEVLDPAALQVAWREVLETLYARYSPRVEGRVPGLAFLQASLSQARELATALHAPVGWAASQEVAHLAALRAAPGEVREVPEEQEKTFLNLTPIHQLHALGLNRAQIDKLAFLGLLGLADLLKWGAAQREAFLGVDAARDLQRFLRGTRTTRVATFVPGEVLEVSLSPDAPLLEPGQAEAALTEMLPPLLTALRGRTCTYLTIKADTVVGVLRETRVLKGALSEQVLLRAAVKALEVSDALMLGIDRLQLQLSGLAQPARQVGLWPDARELDAVRAVLERFPQGLVKVQWRDIYAYAADAQYAWVDWLTGAERFSLMSLRPQGAPVTVPRSGHAAALFEAES